MYFESAFAAMQKVKEQKAEEEKKKPATPAEILAGKDFKVEILNKDKKIVEAEEVIAVTEEKIKKLKEPLSQQPQPKTEMDKFKDNLGKEVDKGKKIDMVDIELNKRIKAVEERAKQEGWSFERFERERDLEIARFQQFAQKNIK